MLQEELPHSLQASDAQKLWSESAMHGAYLVWREYEEAILWERFAGATVFDIGCGSGRLLAKAGTIVKHYTGVDRDPEAIARGKKLYGELLSADFVLHDYRDLLCMGDGHTQPHFDLTICIGNSLGCFEGGEEGTLRTCAAYTDRLFFSVMKASRDVLQRRLQDYYRPLGIPCRVNLDTHTIYSEVWGASRAYNFERLRSIGVAVRGLGFKEPWIIDVPPLGYAVYTERTGLI